MTLAAAILIQALRSSQGSPLNVFDRVYGFLNDWAVILAAAVTLGLVAIGLVTLMDSREHRRRETLRKLAPEIDEWCKLAVPELRKVGGEPGVDLVDSDRDRLLAVAAVAEILRPLAPLIDRAHGLSTELDEQMQAVFDALWDVLEALLADDKVEGVAMATAAATKADVWLNKLNDLCERLR